MKKGQIKIHKLTKTSLLIVKVYGSSVAKCFVLDNQGNKIEDGVDGLGNTMYKIAICQAKYLV